MALLIERNLGNQYCLAVEYLIGILFLFISVFFLSVGEKS